MPIQIPKDVKDAAKAAATALGLNEEDAKVERTATGLKFTFGEDVVVTTGTERSLVGGNNTSYVRINKNFGEIASTTKLTKDANGNFVAQPTEVTTNNGKSYVKIDDPSIPTGDKTIILDAVKTNAEAVFGDQTPAAGTSALPDGQFKPETNSIGQKAFVKRDTTAMTPSLRAPSMSNMS